jgi:hypothetical protein
MRRHWVQVGAALVVAVVGLGLGGGWRAGRHAVDAATEARLYPSSENVEHTVSLTWEEHRRNMATVKTQTTDAGATVAGTLSVLSQTEYPILISGPTKMFSFASGLFGFYIEDISTSGWPGPDPQPDPPDGTVLTYVYYTSRSYYEAGGHVFVYMTDEDDDDIVLPFSLSVTGRELWRTDAYTPGAGRENAPVYAKERHITDTWETELPLSWSMTFGDISTSGTYTGDPPWWIPPQPISAIGIGMNFHKGAADIVYARVSDLTWGGAAVDFSRYEYGTYNSGLYLDGLAGGFDVYYHSAGQTTHSVTMAEPKIVDFSEVHVRDRDGTDVNPRLSGGFRATNHYPATLGWSTTP